MLRGAGVSPAFSAIPCQPFLHRDKRDAGATSFARWPV